VRLWTRATVNRHNFHFWNSERDEMESSWEKALMKCLKVLSRHLPRETEKKFETPYAQKPVWWSTYEAEYALRKSLCWSDSYVAKRKHKIYCKELGKSSRGLFKCTIGYSSSPITVASRSKTWTVFARSNTGFVGSNPTQGMDVCVRLVCVCVVLCVDSGLATGWSPSKESYRLCIGLRN
jgi:hypothetical protein